MPVLDVWGRLEQLGDRLGRLEKMFEDRTETKEQFNERLNKKAMESRAPKGSGWNTESQIYGPAPTEPTLEEMLKREESAKSNLRWEKKQIVNDFREKLIASVKVMLPSVELATALNGVPMPEDDEIAGLDWLCAATAKTHLMRVDAIILEHEKTRDKFAVKVFRVREGR